MMTGETQPSIISDEPRVSGLELAGKRPAPPRLTGRLERHLPEKCRYREDSMRVLVIDIGGSHTKLAIGESDERAEIDSTEKMSPQTLFPRIQAATGHWEYDVVSIGYPGRVGPDGPTQ